MQTIAILGGKGGFGARIARQIAQEKKEIHVICTGSGQENLVAVPKADIIIIAVPIDQTEKTIKEIGPKTKANAVIIDVTSLKAQPVQRMKKYLPKTCTIIPTHPMFGPSLSVIAGQVIVLTPDTKTIKTPIYQQMKKILENKGAKIIETTPQHHDKIMATIQGLTHLTLFVMGETMRATKVDLALSEKFISPIYKLMTSSVARYISQNPGLYADIQINNPYVPQVHKSFMRVAQNFTQDLEKKKFIHTLQKTKKFFGSHAKQGQEYTDKVLYLLGKQNEELQNKKGKHIVCENIYTKTQASGVLSGYTNTTITLNTNKKLELNQRIILH